jgi:uncharacterized membrane protein
MITGILLGIGVVGALDEAIFHQLLQWHTGWSVPSLVLRVLCKL